MSAWRGWRMLPLLMFWAAGTAGADGGHEILNGGSVVVNGDRFELADLHFAPISQQSFRFDEGLAGELRSIQGFLKERFGVVIETKFCTAYGHCEASELFNQFVFDPAVEYQFVTERPRLCHSGSSALGCSSGSITYVIPGPFVKLSLTEKALFILTERLETMFPNVSSELKAEILRDIGLLLRLRDRRVLPWREIYTSDEVAALNAFVPALERLLRRELSFGRRFSVSGKSERFSTLPPGVIRLGE